MSVISIKSTQWWMGLAQVAINAVVIFLLLLPVNAAMAHEISGFTVEQQPISFGPDQTIFDLSNLAWRPLISEGVPPGPEIAVLRGETENAESLEAVLRIPANYTFPNHSHTSDETYIWLKGDFTYIAENGATVELSHHSYISLPGGVPHALVCGDQPCMLYLRYTRPFDLTLYPMPELNEEVSSRIPQL